MICLIYGIELSLEIASECQGSFLIKPQRFAFVGFPDGLANQDRGAEGAEKEKDDGKYGKTEV